MKCGGKKSIKHMQLPPDEHENYPHVVWVNSPCLFFFFFSWLDLNKNSKVSQLFKFKAPPQKKISSQRRWWNLTPRQLSPQVALSLCSINLIFWLFNSKTSAENRQTQETPAEGIYFWRQYTTLKASSFHYHGHLGFSLIPTHSQEAVGFRVSARPGGYL